MKNSTWELCKITWPNGESLQTICWSTAAVSLQKTLDLYGICIAVRQVKYANWPARMKRLARNSEEPLRKKRLAAASEE